MASTTTAAAGTAVLSERLVHTVATELLEQFAGQGEAHHGLDHNGRRWHRGAVGTLVDRLGRLTAGHIHGAQRRGD